MGAESPSTDLVAASAKLELVDSVEKDVWKMRLLCRTVVVVTPGRSDPTLGADICLPVKMRRNGLYSDMRSSDTVGRTI